MNINLSLRKYFSSPCYNKVQKYNPSYVRKIDHCAFRSLNKTQFNNVHKECISFQNGPLLPQKETYIFPEIDVVAGWYKTLSDQTILPRVFSSLYTGNNRDSVEVEDLNRDSVREQERSIYSYERYEELLKQNHYLAWTLLFPYEVNHVGFEVSNIRDVYVDLKKNGFILNGDIQVSDDKTLLQFSLKADRVEKYFVEGKKMVYGSFIEFIERLNGREGFHTRNASKIFESTSQK